MNTELKKRFSEIIIKLICLTLLLIVIVAAFTILCVIANIQNTDLFVVVLSLIMLIALFVACEVIGRVFF